MYQKSIKRLLDLLFSFIMLLILSPIMLIVAILVKVTSKGPVLYKGMRTGYKGKTIYVYKFRSMVANADAVGGDLATGKDPRITKLGKFIRITKLDELPQLINIFKGEMSFIGPRPELVRCAEKFAGEELKILDVRPGLTDFSSVYFVNMEEVVGSSEIVENYEKSILRVKNKLRIKYVNEISFLTDFKLLFMTGFAILGKIFHITKYKYPRASGKRSVLIYAASLDYLYLNHLSLIEKLANESFDIIVAAPFQEIKNELLAMGCKIINYKNNSKRIANKINASVLPDYIISYGHGMNMVSSKSAMKGRFKSILNISSKDTENLNNRQVKKYNKLINKVEYAYCADETFANQLFLKKSNVTIIDNSDEFICNMLIPQPTVQVPVLS